MVPTAPSSLPRRASEFVPVGEFLSRVWRLVRDGWRPVLAIAAVVWVPAAAVIGTAIWSAVSQVDLVPVEDWVERAEAGFNDPFPYTDILPDGFSRFAATVVTAVAAYAVAATWSNAAAMVRLDRLASGDTTGTLRSALVGSVRAVWRLTCVYVAVLVGVAATAAGLSLAAALLGPLSLLVTVPAAVVVGVGVAARLLLVGPAAALGSGSALAGSWQATRGRVWPILGRVLLVGVLSSAATSSVQVVSFGDLPASMVVVAAIGMRVFATLVSALTSGAGAVVLWHECGQSRRDDQDPGTQLADVPGPPALPVV